ncbi:hypothetical protein [uncultured Pseudodesulfovibrio sp.]|uniref:hypothetical protein n=1 Tax=uncultured Pseudodesulfovibrio sp. TaxID=2035858 RepID=UPI0029C8EA45|nr:hypothetical protein [uncultured Pseudodesulfovibrio sp.]
MLKKNIYCLFALCLLVFGVVTPAIANGNEMCVECRVFNIMADVCHMACNMDRYDKAKIRQLAIGLYSDGFKTTIEFLQMVERSNLLTDHLKNNIFVPGIKTLQKRGEEYLQHKSEIDQNDILERFYPYDLFKLHDLYSLFVERSAIDCLQKEPSIENARHADQIAFLYASKSTKDNDELVKLIHFIFAKHENDAREMADHIIYFYNDSHLYDRISFEKEIVPAYEKVIDGRIGDDVEYLKTQIQNIRNRFEKLQTRREEVLALPSLYEKLYGASTQAEIGEYPSILGGGRIKPEYISTTSVGLDPLLRDAMWAYDHFGDLHSLKYHYFEAKSMAEGLVDTLNKYEDMDWGLANTYVLGLYYQDKAHYSSLRDLLYGLNISKKIRKKYKAIEFDVSGFWSKTYNIIFNPESHQEICYSFVKKFFDPTTQNVYENKIPGSMECLVLDRIVNKASGLDERADSALGARATVYQKFFSLATKTEKPFFGLMDDLVIPQELRPL